MCIGQFWGLGWDENYFLVRKSFQTAGKEREGERKKDRKIEREREREGEFINQSLRDGSCDL